MSSVNVSIPNVAELPPKVNEFKRFIRLSLKRPIVMFGMIIVALFILTAALAPLLAPYEPNTIDLRNNLQAPSAEHWLGTDVQGRDTLSRIIYGSRISLMGGVIAVAIAAACGVVLGLLAGFFGGWLEIIIMRVMDSLMAFPMILLALLISALLGGGLLNVMIALGISLMPGYARLMCGQVLSIKENDFIMAERSIGSSSMRVMFRHIFPNCVASLIVMVTMMMGTTILAEAGLSYLGIGVEAPTATWGSMISDGYQYVFSNPVLAFAPGIAIMIVVFAFNMVGDGLRDVLDPRLRGVI
jgi:ABC-type dipeptide/oligopeptide/nickel transport system permease subunit